MGPSATESEVARPKDREGDKRASELAPSPTGREAARRAPRLRAGDRAPAKPAPLDLVQFSVTAPGTLAPGITHVLDVWAHLARLRHAVLERAKAETGPDVRIKSQGPVAVRRGVRFDVRLSIQDLTVVQGVQSMFWDGRIASSTFHVTVPAGIALGLRPGTALIYVGGLRVARLAFTVNVHTGSPSKSVLQADRTTYRTAFASYSSKDRRDVMARVHGLRKAGVDVFMDVLHLRSGQHYEDLLTKMIETRDVFYLFWSRSARKSEWVEKEWKLALDRRGIDYIDPFPLESVEKAPPPPELAAHLHFGDWETAYLAGLKTKPRFWDIFRR